MASSTWIGECGAEQYDWQLKIFASSMSEMTSLGGEVGTQDHRQPSLTNTGKCPDISRMHRRRRLIALRLTPPSKERLPHVEANTAHEHRLLHIHMRRLSASVRVRISSEDVPHGKQSSPLPNAHAPDSPRHEQRDSPVSEKVANKKKYIHRYIYIYMYIRCE